MKKVALFLLLLLFANSFSSFSPGISSRLITDKPVSYPKGYFRNPLGIPIQLAANFGELRTNHYHMGLDIRTNQRENLPVYAAAEGYVSRIKIEQYGFGRAIYINHPNGYTTLYAHLNNFYDKLDNYVKEKQYAEESWEQDVTFEPGHFPVSKGQFIAYSGNTGGSQGPHLHFEIRDTRTGNNLNPWLFDFGLPDKIAPLIYKLYYYDRRHSTYSASPKPIAIKGTGGHYSSVSDVVVLNSPRISFGITTEDKYSASPFRFGIYGATLYIDSLEVSSFHLNNFSYDETRFVNAAIDYKNRMTGGGYIQHLSRLPGNSASMFTSKGDDVYDIRDNDVHTAEIIVDDVSGNQSVLKFNFRRDPVQKEEAVSINNSISMPPQKSNYYETDDLKVKFSPKAFYDTVPFVHYATQPGDRRDVSATHHLLNYTIPVHDSFLVSIRPVAVLTPQLKDRTVMQLKSNRKIEAVKGDWAGNFMQAKFRDLGIFKLIVDTIAPRISLAGWANGGNVRLKRSIALIATDDVGELKGFKAYLDGQWLMFSRKNDSFIYVFDEHVATGRYNLKVIAEDAAGNTTEKNYTFTR